MILELYHRRFKIFSTPARELFREEEVEEEICDYCSVLSQMN